MDSFELNKIAGAVLAALLLWFGAKIVANGIYSPDEPKKPGFVVEVAHTDGGKKEKKEEVKEPPIGELLAAANVDKGQKEAKKCATCHTFDQGGKNKAGPALWGIFDREIASVDGFSYSKALKELGAKKWTAEELSAFLKSPKKYAKGTKMVFKGIKKPAKRADVIKYLSSLK